MRRNSGQNTSLPAQKVIDLCCDSDEEEVSPPLSLKSAKRQTILSADLPVVQTRKTSLRTVAVHKSQQATATEPIVTNLGPATLSNEWLHNSTNGGEPMIPRFYLEEAVQTLNSILHRASHPVQNEQHRQQRDQFSTTVPNKATLAVSNTVGEYAESMRSLLIPRRYLEEAIQTLNSILQQDASPPNARPLGTINATSGEVFENSGQGSKRSGSSSSSSSRSADDSTIKPTRDLPTMLDCSAVSMHSESSGSKRDFDFPSSPVPNPVWSFEESHMEWSQRDDECFEPTTPLLNNDSDDQYRKRQRSGTPPSVDMGDYMDVVVLSHGIKSPLPASNIISSSKSGGNEYDNDRDDDNDEHDEDEDEEGDDDDDDDDDEVIIVAANMDNAATMPHQRECCPVHLFAVQQSGTTPGPDNDTTADSQLQNQQFCDYCYCIVCDVPAKECALWLTGKHYCATVRDPPDQLERQVRKHTLFKLLSPTLRAYILSLVETGYGGGGDGSNGVSLEIVGALFPLEDSCAVAFSDQQIADISVVIKTKMQFLRRKVAERYNVNRDVMDLGSPLDEDDPMFDPNSMEVAELPPSLTEKATNERPDGNLNRTEETTSNKDDEYDEDDDDDEDMKARGRWGTLKSLAKCTDDVTGSTTTNWQHLHAASEDEDVVIRDITIEVTLYLLAVLKNIKISDVVMKSRAVVDRAPILLTELLLLPFCTTAIKDFVIEHCDNCIAHGWGVSQHLSILGNIARDIVSNPWSEAIAGSSTTFPSEAYVGIHEIYKERDRRMKDIGIQSGFRLFPQLVSSLDLLRQVLLFEALTSLGVQPAPPLVYIYQLEYDPLHDPRLDAALLYNPVIVSLKICALNYPLSLKLPLIHALWERANSASEALTVVWNPKIIDAKLDINEAALYAALLFWQLKHQCLPMPIDFLVVLFANQFLYCCRFLVSALKTPFNGHLYTVSHRLLEWDSNCKEDLTVLAYGLPNGVGATRGVKAGLWCSLLGWRFFDFVLTTPSYAQKFIDHLVLLSTTEAAPTTGMSARIAASIGCFLQSINKFNDTHRDRSHPGCNMLSIWIIATLPADLYPHVIDSTPVTDADMEYLTVDMFDKHYSNDNNTMIYWDLLTYQSQRHIASCLVGSNNSVTYKFVNAIVNNDVDNNNSASSKSLPFLGRQFLPRVVHVPHMFQRLMKLGVDRVNRLKQLTDYLDSRAGWTSTLRMVGGAACICLLKELPLLQWAPAFEQVFESIDENTIRSFRALHSVKEPTEQQQRQLYVFEISHLLYQIIRCVQRDFTDDASKSSSHESVAQNVMQLCDLIAASVKVMRSIIPDEASCFICSSSRNNNSQDSVALPLAMTLKEQANFNAVMPFLSQPHLLDSFDEHSSIFLLGCDVHWQFFRSVLVQSYFLLKSGTAASSNTSSSLSEHVSQSHNLKIELGQTLAEVLLLLPSYVPSLSTISSITHAAIQAFLEKDLRRLCVLGLEMHDRQLLEHIVCVMHACWQINVNLNLDISGSNYRTEEITGVLHVLVWIMTQPLQERNTFMNLWADVWTTLGKHQITRLTHTHQQSHTHLNARRFVQALAIEVIMWPELVIAWEDSDAVLIDRILKVLQLQQVRRPSGTQTIEGTVIGLRLANAVACTLGLNSSVEADDAILRAVHNLNLIPYTLTSSKRFAAYLCRQAADKIVFGSYAMVDSSDDDKSTGSCISLPSFVLLCVRTTLLSSSSESQIVQLSRLNRTFTFLNAIIAELTIFADTAHSPFCSELLQELLDHLKIDSVAALLVEIGSAQQEGNELDAILEMLFYVVAGDICVTKESVCRKFSSSYARKVVLLEWCECMFNRQQMSSVEYFTLALLLSLSDLQNPPSSLFEAITHRSQQWELTMTTTKAPRDEGNNSENRFVCIAESSCRIPIVQESTVAFCQLLQLFVKHTRDIIAALKAANNYDNSSTAVNVNNNRLQLLCLCFGWLFSKAVCSQSSRALHFELLSVSTSAATTAPAQTEESSSIEVAQANRTRLASLAAVFGTLVEDNADLFEEAFALEQESMIVGGIGSGENSLPSPFECTLILDMHLYPARVNDIFKDLKSLQQQSVTMQVGHQYHWSKINRAALVESLIHSYSDLSIVLNALIHVGEHRKVIRILSHMNDTLAAMKYALPLVKSGALTALLLKDDGKTEIDHSDLSKEATSNSSNLVDWHADETETPLLKKARTGPQTQTLASTATPPQIKRQPGILLTLKRDSFIFASGLCAWLIRLNQECNHINIEIPLSQPTSSEASNHDHLHVLTATEQKYWTHFKSVSNQSGFVACPSTHKSYSVGRLGDLNLAPHKDLFYPVLVNTHEALELYRTYKELIAALKAQVQLGLHQTQPQLTELAQHPPVVVASCVYHVVNVCATMDLNSAQALITGASSNSEQRETGCDLVLHILEFYATQVQTRVANDVHFNLVMCVRAHVLCTLIRGYIMTRQRQSQLGADTTAETDGKRHIFVKMVTLCAQLRAKWLHDLGTMFIFTQAPSYNCPASSSSTIPTDIQQREVLFRYVRLLVCMHWFADGQHSLIRECMVNSWQRSPQQCTELCRQFDEHKLRFVTCSYATNLLNCLYGCNKVELHPADFRTSTQLLGQWMNCYKDVPCWWDYMSGLALNTNEQLQAPNYVITSFQKHSSGVLELCCKEFTCSGAPIDEHRSYYAHILHALDSWRSLCVRLFLEFAETQSNNQQDMVTYKRAHRFAVSMLMMVLVCGTNVSDAANNANTEQFIGSLFDDQQHHHLFIGQQQAMFNIKLSCSQSRVLETLLKDRSFDLQVQEALSDPETLFLLASTPGAFARLMETLIIDPHAHSPLQRRLTDKQEAQVGHDLFFADFIHLPPELINLTQRQFVSLTKFISKSIANNTHLAAQATTSTAASWLESQALFHNVVQQHSGTRLTGATTFIFKHICLLSSGVPRYIQLFKSQMNSLLEYWNRVPYTQPTLVNLDICLRCLHLICFSCYMPPSTTATAHPTTLLHLHLQEMKKDAFKKKPKPLAVLESFLNSSNWPPTTSNSSHKSHGI